MLSEKSKNLIREEMLSLPKEMQDAISSLDWERVSEEIGKKYLLDGDEIETFQLETACFLLGLTSEDFYIGNIEIEVGTSKEEAVKISEEVIQKIFTPIYSNFEEKLKNDLPNKSVNWQQNLDFVLSGGNYSAFVNDREATKDNLENK